MMFQPTRDEVRRFFCEAWRKHRAGLALAAQEKVAVACMLEHPEYHPLLDDPVEALERDFPVEAGQENPFLHLSLHLAIEEQLSIDQPKGIGIRLQLLQGRRASRHEALHDVMECLAEMLWRTQRGNVPSGMDELNAAYLECLDRRAGR